MVSKPATSYGRSRYRSTACETEDRQYPFEDELFDVITSGGGLHHMECSPGLTRMRTLPASRRACGDPRSRTQYFDNADLPYEVAGLLTPSHALP